MSYIFGYHLVKVICIPLILGCVTGAVLCVVLLVASGVVTKSAARCNEVAKNVK